MRRCQPQRRFPEGENGFVIDPYNSEEFAEKMEAVLKDQHLRNKMRTKSKEIVEKFRFINISKGYIEAIEDSMKE